MSQTLHTRFFKLPTFTPFRLGSAFGGIATTQILIKIGPSAAQVGDGSVLTGIDSHQSVVHYPLKFNFSTGGGGGGGGSAPTVFATMTPYTGGTLIVLSNLIAPWIMYDTSGSNPTPVASAPFSSTPFDVPESGGDFALGLHQSDVDGWWNASPGNSIGPIFTFDSGAGQGLEIIFRPGGMILANVGIQILNHDLPATTVSSEMASPNLTSMNPLSTIVHAV